MLILLEQYSTPVLRVKRLTLYTMEADKVVDLEEKALTNLMIDIAVELLLLRHASTGDVVEAFDGLRGKDTEALEVAMCFKLLLKIQKEGRFFGGDEAIYTTITAQAEKRAASENFCSSLREELKNYLESVPAKHLAEALNNLAPAMECALRTGRESKELISLIFKRYMEA